MSERHIRFLKVLCNIYIAKNGKIKSSLSKWTFSGLIWMDSKFEGILPEGNPNNKGDSLREIFSELEHLGYIRKSNERNRYLLTEEGYLCGTEAYWQKQLNYLNRNPGLAIVVSFFALVVSIAALYISLEKP